MHEFLQLYEVHVAVVANCSSTRPIPNPELQNDRLLEVRRACVSVCVCLLQACRQSEIILLRKYVCDVRLCESWRDLYVRCYVCQLTELCCLLCCVTT